MFINKFLDFSNKFNRANEALEKHATFVMSTLDETISNIDNYDYIKDLSLRTGGSHQRFSDFQKENFSVCILTLQIIT